MASVTCITRTGATLPDPIVDVASLSVTIDNQGIAKLSISVLRLDKGSITGGCSIDLGGGRVFDGFIDTDFPQQLAGTDYIEHRITAIGMIGAGGGGGGSNESPFEGFPDDPYVPPGGKGGPKRKKKKKKKKKKRKRAKRRERRG